MEVVLEVVVGAVALPTTLVMEEDSLNLMNAVLMVATVEEEVDLLVAAVAVEEIPMLVIGKTVFTMLDLVTPILKRNYSVLLKIKK